MRVPLFALARRDERRVVSSTPVLLADLFSTLLAASGAPVSDSEPTRVAELRQRLEGWRREVGTQLPTPNRAFHPKK